MKKISSFILIITLVITSMVGFTASLSYADTIYIFSDVKKTPWAAEAIQVLYEKGVISGYDDKTFGVEDPITREQFAKVLSLTFGVDQPDANIGTYSDVAKEEWSFGYIESVKEYLTGYYPPNGKPFFSPRTNATREDVAVALVRMMGLDTKNIDGKRIVENNFYDSDEISPRLINEVAAAFENNLIKGYPDGTFRPNAPIDRASVATLLYRVMKSSYANGSEDIKLTVDMPETVNNSKVDVTVKVDEGAELYINDEKVSTNSWYGYPNYTYDLTKGEGEYEFTFKVVYNGRTKTETKKVTYQLNAPEIKLDKVDEITDKSLLTLKGTVKDSLDSYPELTINGSTVYVNYDGSFKKDITLEKGKNEVVIVAKNKKGKETKVAKTISFISKGPVVKWDNWVDETTSESIQIAGSVIDANDKNPKLYINNKQISINSYSGNKFKEELKLNVGKNVITIKVVNNMSETYEVTKEITFKSQGPTITFISVPENTDSKTITIKGSVKDNNDKYPKVFMNDKEVYVDYRGEFSKEVSLSNGENKFKFRALNKLGQESKVEKTVIFGSAGPKITIITLNEKTDTLTETVKIKVEDKNDRYPTVTINGEEVRINYYNEYKKDIQLKEGDNEIIIKAVNSDGVESVVTKNIKVEIHGPSIVADVPSTTNKNSIRVIAVVTDKTDSNPSVTINNREVRKTYSDRYEKDIELVKGQNTITIEATNKYGKTTKINKVVNFEEVGPNMEISVDSVVNKDTTTMNIRLEDPNEGNITLYINDSEIRREWSDNYNIELKLEPGKNDFKIVAKSSATDKVTTAERTINFDVKDPEINVNLPETSQSDSITISGNVYDKADDNPTLTVNGESVDVNSSGSWNISLQLQEGDNIVVIEATNKYGKSTKIDKTIKYESETTEETPEEVTE